MSKYNLGEAHQGNPIVSNHYLADNANLTNEELCGYALALNSDGKVVKADGSLQFLGVGVSKGVWSENEKSVAVLKKGQKVLVKTNGTAAIGSIVNVDSSGVFTSASGQPTSAIFVAQDDVEVAEELPENTALIDLL